ncbi:hypothetical protein EDM57_04660 [Brevibacillus gelatini]|uniref:Uncharacterized protein n=1 Tax=Brevibacillus gelatini TaxID=1655277 RepID=A0A3M8B8Y5_9BACL|nr:hypothetical protein [Brevibacillus gelatini]RNB59437.1 hypothetical protein EDM57_04660 [Brevibacillus gelatini]
MVDFKKLHDDWWNSLSEDQREFINERKRLEKEHTYYTTETMLDNDYIMIKYGKDRKEEKQKVVLYRPVYSDNQVSEKILLSFGGYREYSFDRRFINSILERLNDENRRFCIDGGGEVYVKNNEMKRIFNEAIEALERLNIEIADDYYPSLTNSDMGKMLESLGLR